MLFSSVVFLLLFLPVVLWLHWLGGARFRNLLLLLASLVFYAWGEGFYALVMVTSILLNYVFGLAIQRWHHRWVLVTAITANLGMLLWFKYAGWLAGMINIGLVWLGPQWQLPIPQVHMPLGISFFTFQAISYVVDVWRRDVSPQGNLINYAMYKALFPQLIAGPIVRYRDVKDDVNSYRFSMDETIAGLERFIWGLGKKVIIANPLGETADALFHLPSDQLGAGQAWLAVVAYALQIYFDFSGYSCMAIGLGRMLGFRFLENFQHPYAAQSVQDFWRRWHISLSSWFRDYLYIPLGGSRVAPWRIYANLMIVFVLCGLWHGASWTFVAWGMWHGLFLIVERAWLGAALERVWRPVRHAYALVTVLMGWVLFRAADFTQVGHLLTAMSGGGAATAETPPVVNGQKYVVLAIGALVCVPLLPALWRRCWAWLQPADATLLAHCVRQGTYWRLVALATVLLYAVAQVARQTYNPFIYFRF